MAKTKVARLSLEGLFHPTKKIKYLNDAFTELEWLPNGNLFGHHEKDDVTTFYSLDPETWRETRVIDSKGIRKLLKDLGVSKTSLQSELDPVWNHDHFAFALVLEGGIYYADVKENISRQLVPQGSQPHALTFSPDGSHLAFARDYDLYVVNVSTAQTTRLTKGGSKTLWNGCAEAFVNIEKAFWWSPDAKRIYFLQQDVSEVPATPLVDYSSRVATVSFHHSKFMTGLPYPKHQLGVADLRGKLTWLENPYTEEDLEDIDLTFDQQGKPIAQYLVRGRKWIALHRHHGKTSTRLVLESKGAWQDSRDLPIFLKDGSFLWTSERTGYRHLYQFDKNGKVLRQVTQGDWMVQKLHGYDANTGRVFFDARGEHSHLGIDAYSIGLDGTDLRRLTKARGNHAVRWNPSFSKFLDIWDNAEHPYTKACFDAHGNELKRLYETPATEVKALGLGKVTFQQVPARDGTPLETMLILPPNFDSKKKYPVFQYVYGFSSNDVYSCPVVVDRWHDLFFHFLAQQGYVVWICDSRASSGKSATTSWTFHKRTPEAELQDQLDGLTWLKKQGWADTNRVAVHGYSTGGYMTLYFASNSDAYKVTISGGVFDWGITDADEHHMGTLESNRKGYERTSILKTLPNLHGKLLIIQGLSDMNTVFQNVVQIIEVLEQTEKDYQLVLVPGATHNLWATSKSTWTFYRNMWEFIRKHL